MELRVYKLKYSTREEGIRDLFSKGVMIDEETYSSTTQAVVDLGNGLFDIMVDCEYNFGINQIEPTTPDHIFAGFDVIYNLEEEVYVEV